MARSRGPVLPPGGQAAHAGAEPALPAYPHHPQPHHGHPQQVQPPPQYGTAERGYDGYSYPSFPPQQPYQPPVQQDPRYAAAPEPANHGYPGASESFGNYAQDPRYGAPVYDRGGGQGHRPPHDPNYPPAFDQYAPQGAPPPAYPAEPLAYNQPPADPRWAPQAEPGFQDYRRPPAYDRAAPPAPYAEPEPELRGGQFDQWPQPDARGYDLGAYAAGQGGGHPQPGFGVPAQEAQRAWPGQGGPYAEPPRFDQQIDQNPGALQPYDQDQDQDEDEEPEEAPRRSRGRGLLIVAALVGAIGLGGGLAYAYKMFLAAPPSNAARVVKAPQQPAKTQPADPGGRKFANTDSKVMDRLPSDGTAGQGDPAGDEQSGARRVQTIPVTRDGALAAPAPAPQPLLPPGSSIVPGMTIVNGGVRAPQVAESVGQAPPQQQPGRVAVAPLRPQIVAKAEPEPEPEPAPAAPQRRAPVLAAPAAPPPAAPKAAVPVRAPAATASGAPAGAGAEPARKSTGFVVVLASQKSRMEALTTFADLQQKYGSVLADKVPDVQEADLSSRNLGTVYRLVVGPAGPREKALGVCNQLKAAGYQGCWVTGN
ncbi:MAG: SPOR domain-containing protein [Hyphomicrobiaceae bacterium]